MRAGNAAAIREYRLAGTHRVARDTHTRVRASAYQNLSAVLEQRTDLNGLGARIRLRIRGDPSRAIRLGKQALTTNCTASASCEIRGLTEYMKWAPAHGPRRIALIEPARILLAVDPRSLLMSAMSRWTQPAAAAPAAAA